ncbi:MAG: hypothetical protein ACREBU_20800, partial [Nitrososphaera sp.]
SLYNTNVRAFTEKYLRENPTTTGAYQKGSKTLFFDANQSPDKLLEAVAHEGLGHRVQDITGMPGGADPDQIYKHLVDSDGYFKLLESGVPRAEAQAMARSAAYDLYRDKIGEVHAFDIGGRVKRSPAERLGISAPLIGTPRVQYWDKGDIPTADLMDQALELRQLEQLSRLGLFYQ